MNKLVNHFPPPILHQNSGERVNDKTNHRGRACPPGHKTTIQIEEHHDDI